MQLSFLEFVAQFLKEQHGEQVHSIQVVVPNKRAGLFLKKALSKAYAKPIIAPKIIGISELISQVSSVSIPSNFELQMHLYACYTALLGEKAEPLDEFLKWSKIALGDFQEIDLYLIDNKQVFDNLTEAKILESWDVEATNPTELRERYFSFWNTFKQLYFAFNEYLSKRNLAYTGMLYRSIASNPAAFFRDANPNSIVLAGFSTLNKCEEAIFEYLQREKIATALWDTDDYYVDNPDQEAGIFIRRLKSMWAEKYGFIECKGNLEVGLKDISIHSISSTVGQVKMAAELVEQIPEAELSNTCVMLTDEALLVPFLHSLPQQVKKVNVTMGYPIQQSFIRGLISSIFNLWTYAKGPHNAPSYYVPHLRLFFENELIQKVLSDHQVQFIEEHFSKTKEFNVTVDQLVEWSEPLKDALELLFSARISGKEAFEKLVEFIELLKDKLIAKKGDYRLEIDQLFVVHEALSAFLKTLYEFSTYELELKTAKTLALQVISQLKVDLYGEPLQGLQVMGFLETRNLDFKHIIMVGVNDDVLPASKKEQSFIPFDLKRGFQLPTYIEKDAIYAYHFYRLIERAERIDLIYCSNADGLSSGELSRFALQLKHEYSAINKKQIQEFTYKPYIETSTNTINSVEKTEEVLQRIQAKLKAGLSPSALSKLIECPLDFYYRYVVGVREQSDFSEEIEHSTFGTILHNVLEEAYKPYEGNLISEQIIERIQMQLPNLIDKHFELEYVHPNKLSGQPYLYYTMSKELLANFLAKEKAMVQSTEVLLQKVEQEFKFQLGVVNGVEVNIAGKIDRVDVLNANPRILDYKTGTVDAKQFKFTEVVDVLNDSEKRKSLQLMIYAFGYYLEKKKEFTHIEITNYSFKQNEFKGVELPLNNNEIYSNLDQLFEEFRSVLLEKVQDLLNPEKPLEHDEEAKYCTICATKEKE